VGRKPTDRIKVSWRNAETQSGDGLIPEDIVYFQAQCSAKGLIVIGAGEISVFTSRDPQARP
jgi:hypothetical protein